MEEGPQFYKPCSRVVEIVDSIRRYQDYHRAICSATMIDFEENITRRKLEKVRADLMGKHLAYLLDTKPQSLPKIVLDFYAHRNIDLDFGM